MPKDQVGSSLDTTSFRRWLANKLARVARRIYPQSEEVMAFHTDRMMEMVLTGNSFIKVQALDPADVKIIHSKLGDLYETK